MLEERDKLMEKLRECQESYNESTKKLSLVETDNGILMRQLQALMPDVRPPPTLASCPSHSGTMPLPLWHLAPPSSLAPCPSLLSGTMLRLSC